MKTLRAKYVLEGARMLIKHTQGRYMLSVSRGELTAARQLIGLFKQPGGLRWKHIQAWRDRCLSNGLDPSSLEVTDSERFLEAIARIEQRKKKRVVKVKPVDLGNTFRRRILSED